MMDALRAALSFVQAHREQIAIGAGVGLVSFVGGMALVAFVLVRMPEDYLEKEEEEPFLPGRPAWMRVSARIGKNLLGVLGVALGVMLSLPGVPGPGALVILIGVMLLDIPGKRRLERRFLGAPKMRSFADRVRARFGRPPLRASTGAGSRGSSPPGGR
ncbi:hypothetical protein BE17_16840 [Sorangium cellulosum]|uniref:Transmembrane protein (PGPGW) n=1 Tax=Sorangium cellulosum TaxID=56 RepID=A0A150T0T7_SORCE|nr:hypothetical protein BE17_16840 [Sorangium cellulosum]